MLTLGHTLGEGFRKRFELVPAITSDLAEYAYRVRHSVYCEDLGFEPIRSDGREVDEYDAQATSILIRHTATGEFVACARLIRVQPSAPDAPLPFELACGDRLDRALIDKCPIPRERVAEASRLAIIAKYRRRKGEASTPAPLFTSHFGGGNIPRFPYILVGLYLGLVALAEQQKVLRLFLLTEPRLAHHFSKFGIDIVQVGDTIEHRGVRIPSMLSVDSVVGRMNAYIRPLYDHIVKQVRTSEAHGAHYRSADPLQRESPAPAQSAAAVLAKRAD